MLRHQLAVLKRSIDRPRIHDSDRTFWIPMMRALKERKEVSLIVKPETAVTLGALCLHVAEGALRRGSLAATVGADGLLTARTEFSVVTLN